VARAISRAVTEALPWRGSFVGEMSPSSLTQMVPAHSTLRSPAAAMRQCGKGRSGGYSSSRRAISRSASEPRSGRPSSSSIAPMRLRTVRRSTPRAAAVEETFRSASK